MYKIEATIRSERLNEVKDPLIAQGLAEFIVADVHGHGSQPGQRATYRGLEYEIPFTHQLRVELSVSEHQLQMALECIVKAARTGKAGDGKVFVQRLSDVFDISEYRPVSLEQPCPTARPDSP